ncbi:MAG: PadR family transcriptional regulator [Candidatus Hydrogenedentes bacterium]|nr:PadR family transcriptional regulator [Candidatus Hydrogenedentota bacterium]
MATDNLQGSLNLLVMKVLSRRAPMHGYAIMSAIQQASDDALRVEQGSLYPALHRMEEAGWIAADWMESETGKRVRGYTLTNDGRKELEAVEKRWVNVTSAVNRVLRVV